MQSRKEDFVKLFWQSLTLSDITVFYFGFRIAQLPAIGITDVSITLGGQVVVPSANGFLEVQFETTTRDGKETHRLPVYLGRTDCTVTELFFSDIEERGVARIRNRLRNQLIIETCINK